MDIFIKILSPIANIFMIPKEILPLGIMRTISGGASIGLLNDVFNTYGVDSVIGNIGSTILGSSETTLYVIAVYSAAVNIKNTKYVLSIALICDFVAVCVASWIWLNWGHS